MPVFGAEMKKRPPHADKKIMGNAWRKREGITMSARGPRRSLLEARLAKLPQATNCRPLFLLFVGASLGSIPRSFRQLKTWRKREGIEPTGDISASRPDLKSGGATSAPSASVMNYPPPRCRGEITSPSSFPSLAASSTSPSGACGAGSPVSAPSSCSPPCFLRISARTL